MQGESDLPDIVGTLGAAGRFANLLNGGEQQPHQNANDGDYYQQFNQREAGMMTCDFHDYDLE